MVIVERMRRNIRLQVATSSPSRSQFEISYTGTHPETVQKVTEKLAAYFIDESLKTSARRVEGTLAFLEMRIQETGHRVAAVATDVQRLGNTAAAIPKRLELEVVQNTYKNLLMTREEFLGMVDMERRQIGEQFILLDAAKRPERPIGPPRATLTLLGGGAGIAAAVLVLLLDAGRRFFLHRRRRDLAGDAA
jgi:uncharacterized protein involved in exopolysaccharide biosynthesis